MRHILTIISLCALPLTAFSTNSHADKPEGLSPQTISLPSGPTSLKGLGESFSPNVATGTANYGVPLQVPPGFLAPSLKLAYNTGSGKSEIAVGWSLPKTFIYRTTDKGMPDFDDQDRFAISGSSLNDELVLVDASNHIYRLKNEGSFALFIRNKYDNSWTIKLSNGHTMSLGTTDSSRQANGYGTYRWYLDTLEDRFSHTCNYTYLRHEGHVYLQEIKYNNHAPQSMINTVTFTYTNRPDMVTDYTYGEADTTQKRLSSITMEHGNRVIYKYNLTYETRDLYSLLSSVTMSGEDGLSMPSLTFTYAAHDDRDIDITDMRQNPPVDDLLSGQAVFEDINGDSLPDILVGDAGAYHYYENIDGKKWAKNPINLGLAQSPDRDLRDSDVVLADINGDGFRDVVYAKANEFAYYTSGNVHENLFYGFDGPFILQTAGALGIHFGSNDVKLADVNKDKRTDMIFDGPGLPQVIINTEDNTLEESFLPELPADIEFTDSYLSMMDANGDGHLDFILKDITISDPKIRIWYGLGYGLYTSDIRMKNVPQGLQEEFFLQDINHDGQVDLLRISGTSTMVYLNDGQDGFTSVYARFDGLPAAYDTEKVLFSDLNGNGTTDIVFISTNHTISYVDLMVHAHAGLLRTIDNGMGQVTTITYDTSTNYMIAAKDAGSPWALPMNSPLTIVASIATSDSFDKLGLSAQETLTTYKYRDGYYDGIEREFRGFGEVTTIEHGDTSHDSKITRSYFHVGRNLDTGLDEEILKGKPYRQEIYDSSDRLLQAIETQWTRTWLCQEDLGASAANVLPLCDHHPNKEEDKDDLVAFATQNGVLTGSFEGLVDGRFTYQSFSYDSWGNTIATNHYGEVDMPSSYAIGDSYSLGDMDTGIGNDEVITQSSFINDIGQWLVKIPYTVSVYDLNGALQSQTTNYYDGNDFEGLDAGYITKGLLSKVTQWYYDGSNPERTIIKERNAYTKHGQKRASMDANDNVHSFFYDDATGFFLTQEQIEVEYGTLTYDASYDSGLGQIVSATDFNGNTTQVAYDSLARVTAIAGPLETLSQPQQRFQYEYGTQNYPLSTTTIEKLIDRDLGTYQTAMSYSDGLGRARLSVIEAEAPYNFIASGYQTLSKRGKPVSVYQQYALTSYDFNAPGSDILATTTTYDALDRTVTVTPPALNGEVTYSKTLYKPFETWVYDERDISDKTWNYPAITRVDGQGRTVGIIKNNDIGGNPEELLWQVGYDTLGNITSIIDPQDNERHYTYDSLKRLLSVDDPNAGTIAYTYDDVGNLLTRTDGLSQITSFIYGMANRLSTKTITNQAGGLADYSYNYYYDSPSDDIPDATNTLGQVSSIYGPWGHISWSYDEYNRVVKTAHSLNTFDGTSQLFMQSVEYDAQGKITQATLPEGFVTEYTYNPRDLIAEVQAGFGADRSYGSTFDYTVHGNVSKSDGFNDVTTCQWYDDRLRLLGILVEKDVSSCGNPSQATGTSLKHLNYTITPEGMITGITDLSPTVTNIPRLDASYKYDRLYQLTESKTTEGIINYTYDTIQNLKTRTNTNAFSDLPVGNLTYGENGAGPNAVTSAFGDSYSYNAIGQMTAYNSFGLTFNGESRLVSAQRIDGSSLSMKYDFLGERAVEKVTIASVGDKESLYPFDTFNIKDGNSFWYVKANGQTVAEVAITKNPAPPLSVIDQLILDGATDLFDALDQYWTQQSGGEYLEKVRYYHQDHLGGPTHITDGNGEQVSFTRFYPYGKKWQEQGYQPNHEFAAAKRELLKELGLKQFGARWYSTRLGRWISPDPLFVESPTESIGSVLELNLFSYSSNNPVMFKDPSGEETTGELIDRKGMEFAQSGNTLGTAAMAFAQSTWDFFGMEGVSKVADAAGSSRKLSAGDYAVAALEVATLGKGGGAVAGAAAIIRKGAIKLGSKGAKIITKTSKLIQSGKIGKKLSKVISSKKVEKIGGGKFTKTTEIRPGYGPGQNRAEYSVYKNANGKVIRTNKITYDRANNYQHKKPLAGGPEGRPAN